MLIMIVKEERGGRGEGLQDAHWIPFKAVLMQLAVMQRGRRENSVVVTVQCGLEA